MKTSKVAAFALSAAVLFLGPITFAQVRNINYFNSGLSEAYGIAAGPDGALWYQGTDSNGATFIGRMTVLGAVTSFRVPYPGSILTNGMAAGPDGSLWFTDDGTNSVGRVCVLTKNCPTGTITEYPIPTPHSTPTVITAGPFEDAYPDGVMWFTEQDGNNIGKISVSGQMIAEYPIPPASGAQGIVAGADGALWFTERFVDKVGRVTTNGVVTQFATPPGSYPIIITAGSDGALWFTEYLAGKIGRITTTGVVTEFSSPQPVPRVITNGPDGNLWLTCDNGSQFYLCVINPNPKNLRGTSTLLSSGNTHMWLTGGPDGSVWFTSNSQIGQAIPVARRNAVQPAP